MKRILTLLLTDVLLSTLLGLGVVSLVSPAFVFWWIYANHTRYVWIITGPWPYNQLGDPQFQLGVFVSLLVMGIALLTLAVVGRTLLLRKRLHTT